MERFFELVPITSALADEPRTAAVVKSYEDRLGTELDTVVATSRVPLDADTVRLRAAETNLGDLFADAMRAAVNADITIVNAGSIRGDRVYPPGPLTRRTVIEMHPFGSVICKVAVPGRVVLQALNSGVSKLPATAGQFPQVSGSHDARRCATRRSTAVSATFVWAASRSTPARPTRSRSPTTC